MENKNFNNSNSSSFLLLFTNLKLLDFHLSFPKEFSNLNINSFNKQNSSLMCGIIYFLLTKFNNENKNKFSFCYPVTTLKELKDFKEIVFIEIQNIFVKDDELILISKSVLDSAYGERLIKLLRGLSDKVLVNEINKLKSTKLLNSKENNNFIACNRNSLQDKFSNMCKSKEHIEWKRKATMVNIILQKNKLIENLKKANKIQSEWKTFANNLENEIQDLEKEKVSIQRKYKNFNDKVTDSSIYSDISALDRAPKLENHKMFREMIESLYTKLEDKSEFINNLDYIDNNTQIYEYIFIFNFFSNINQDFFKNEQEKKNKDINYDIESIFFLHEKVKDYNNVIINTKAKNKNNLNEINDVLKVIIDKNVFVNNNLKNLISELNSDII